MRNDPLSRVVARWAAIAGLLGATALSSGCAATKLAAWDRDLMARKEMQLNTHPQITAAHEHIYFSKEGSSGGRTYDGGGCGCN